MHEGNESHEPLHARIDELAGAEAEGLVEEALAQARARVLEELTDAIARSLRERVGAGQATATTTQADVAPAADAGQLAWYVFGVVAAKDARIAEGLSGIDPDHPATTLSEGALAAVVSHVPIEEFAETTLREHLSDMAWVEATARAHEHALEELRRQATVIPMRMCSVYRTEDGVQDMLRREQRALADGLAHLRGKSEWGLKALADSRFTAEQSDRPLSGGDEEAAGAGTAYLARRREERDAVERVEQLLEEAARQIHERLRTSAVEGRVLPLHQAEPDAPEMILNGVYLVADADEASFHERVRELDETFGPLGVELRETGPWPAYNFVPGTIGATW